MPSGQPFTRLCQHFAQLRAEGRRADLHIHTTHSDGEFTPEEVVRLAKTRGLGALAITDHDNCSAIAGALLAASRLESPPEIITGVEISCTFRGRELHLLGYFFDPADAPLAAALGALREQRRERFATMIERLPAVGLSIPAADLAARQLTGHSLGRRDLAVLLLKHGQVATIPEAFGRYLHDNGPVDVPKRGLPVAEALALLRGAGGVSSWAHPPPDVDLRQVEELRSLGLDALEAAYPAFRASRERAVREIARAAGLAITGGSDCHGPSPASRALGSRGVRREELESLRNRQPMNGQRRAVPPNGAIPCC